MALLYPQIISSRIVFGRERVFSHLSVRVNVGESPNRRSKCPLINRARATFIAFTIIQFVTHRVIRVELLSDRPFLQVQWLLFFTSLQSIART